MSRIRTGGWKLAGALLALGVGLVCLGGYEIGWLGFISATIESPPTAAFLPPYPECRVAILRSEYSSTFFHSPKTYEAHIEYWQKLLKRLEMPVEVISDSQLESGVQGFQTLILPAAICLSKKEKASIRALLANGRGVICTWATGARDEAGEWQGLDFLGELTGADKFEFGQRPPPWYVSFVTSRPTTAGTPGGFRVQVDSPDRLQARRFTVDGYWSDSHLSPQDPNLPVNFQGAQVHNTLGSGRVVWFGFQENTAVAGGYDQTLLDQALTNALVWAGQQALAAVDPWPSAYSAASIFACDVEEDVDNATYAASTLRKAQANGTFFCVSNLVEGNPELVRQLRGAGEVASHGDTPTPFDSGGRTSQTLRLVSSKWELWRAGGGGTTGFHPPADVFADATVCALAASHFHYWLTGLEGGTPADSVLPEIHRVSQSLGWFHRDTDLVRLRRTFEDDLHYSPLGIVGLEPAWITQRALSDFEIVHGLGGLYVFDYHSQGFSTPEYVGILARLIEEFNQSATWIATAAEVAEWWESRSHVAVKISNKKANGLRLTVKYVGTKPLNNVTLSVFPPGNSTHARVVAVGPNPPAEVLPENVDDRLTVRLGRLPPRSTCQYDLMWAQ